LAKKEGDVWYGEGSQRLAGVSKAMERGEGQWRRRRQLQVPSGIVARSLLKVGSRTGGEDCSERQELEELSPMYPGQVAVV